MQHLVILAYVLSGSAVVRLISDLGGVCSSVPVGFRRSILVGLDVNGLSSNGVVLLARPNKIIVDRLCGIDGLCLLCTVL